MIRIFRKIKSLDWKYAIIEIGLIVVGILIALQVNNWNEQRKESVFEEKILSEIQSALQSDHEFHIKSRIKRGETILNACDDILKFLEEDIPYHDSLQNSFWRLNWIMVFEPQTVAFETLRSKGIETVQDDDLRLKLLSLYDYNFPSTSFFTTDLNNWTTNRVEPFCLSHFEIIPRSRGKSYRPIDLSDLRKSTYYKNLVLEKKSGIEGVLYRFKLLEEKIEAILLLLDQELNVLKK